MLRRAHSRMVRGPGMAGFTLVELCVAMAAGVVVMIGATTIMLVTMRQSQRTFTRVDATRRARVAFANIENELHSACVDGRPPIAGVTAGGTVQSDADNLVFLSYTGAGATPTPLWHRLTFDPSGAGRLTDTAYDVSGTAPDWTIGSQVSTTTLLTNVHPRSGTDVFRYYAYQPEYTDGGGNVYWTIPDGQDSVPISGATPDSPLSTSAGLSAADAANVVEVVIALRVGPSASDLSNPRLTSVYDSVSDTISLRLTTPPDYVPAGTTPQGYGPCQ